MSEKRDPERVVREIKRKTRRKFSAEEKIRIVLEGMRGEDSVDLRSMRRCSTISEPGTGSNVVLTATRYHNKSPGRRTDQDLRPYDQLPYIEHSAMRSNLGARHETTASLRVWLDHRLRNSTPRRIWL